MVILTSQDRTELIEDLTNYILSVMSPISSKKMKICIFGFRSTKERIAYKMIHYTTLYQSYKNDIVCYFYDYRHAIRLDGLYKISKNKDNLYQYWIVGSSSVVQNKHKKSNHSLNKLIAKDII